MPPRRKRDKCLRIVLERRPKSKYADIFSAVDEYMLRFGGSPSEALAKIARTPGLLAGMIRAAQKRLAKAPQ